MSSVEEVVTCAAATEHDDPDRWRLASFLSTAGAIAPLAAAMLAGDSKGDELAASRKIASLGKPALLLALHQGNALSALVDKVWPAIGSPHQTRRRRRMSCTTSSCWMGQHSRCSWVVWTSSMVGWRGSSVLQARTSRRASNVTIVA